MCVCVFGANRNQNNTGKALHSAKEEGTQTNNKCNKYITKRIWKNPKPCSPSTPGCTWSQFGCDWPQVGCGWYPSHGTPGDHFMFKCTYNGASKVPPRSPEAHQQRPRRSKYERGGNFGTKNKKNTSNHARYGPRPAPRRPENAPLSKNSPLGRPKCERGAQNQHFGTENEHNYLNFLSFCLKISTTLAF